MKKIILILILICLSSFVLAGEVLNTYCGDGICESLEEIEGNCCEDCGDCMGLVVEKVQTVDVVEKDIKKDVVKTVDVVEKDIKKGVVKTDDSKNYEDKAGSVEVREKKRGVFGIVIGFFKRLFVKEEKEKEIQTLPEIEVKCPDGICDELEMREGACTQDCKDIEGWGKKTETDKVKTPKENVKELQNVDCADYDNNKDECINHKSCAWVEKGGYCAILNRDSVCGNGICEPSEEAENTCCEDCKEGGCGSQIKGSQIVDIPENCGDGICDDWNETSDNCPQDCGYDGVKIVDDEDEFKKNYDDIMAEMKDIIPEVPEKEKLLDISSFYTPSATCYFSAGASLANYMEDLSYDEFIWYGRPLHFQYDTRWDTLRTGVGGGELTFESFYNLGYKSYVGRTTKMYLPTPERLHMQASRNFIFFDTDEEALDFIKRLLSADIPVMINLQIGTSPDFLFIKGYDETHIFIPPYVESNGEYILSDEKQLFSEEAIENKDTQSLTYEKFFSLWKGSGNTFYWFVKNNERKTEQEIFQINKKDAEEDYDNVQKFIGDLNFEVHTSGEDLITATASASRYLTKQGYEGPGTKYMELAALYDKQRDQWQTKGIYSQTAELYKEAAGLW